MASTPDIDRPVFGYFVTPEYSEVTEYVLKLLRRYNLCIYFNLHASALFSKEENTTELHLPINSPIVLDPQLPDVIIRELLENQYFLCQEHEHYENVEGSGFTFIPGTIRYWFKVYVCQPNDPANPNENNTTNNDDPNDNDDNEDDEILPSHINHCAYAILEHYARKENIIIPREVFLRRQTLQQFNVQFNYNLDLNIRVNMQDLAEYHNSLKKFNIRVFSMKGNVLYATRFSPEDDEYIDLYLNSNNQFAYVRNLWALFKKKHDRIFCMNCMKWKSNKHVCEKVRTSPKTDEIFMPDVPPERHALVAYCDFESIIKNTGHHFISGWGCVIIDRDHKVYESNLMNYNDNNELIVQYLDYLTSKAVEFAEVNCEDTPNCQICGLDIRREPVTIQGRNFINGKSGSHHKKCWSHSKNTMYVFFHNFRGYDSHFLIKHIVNACDVLGLSATSMEKFNLIRCTALSHNLITLTFKDTFNFFTSSLAKCASMIEDWRYTPEEERNGKGLFPYDWFDSYDKLNVNGLPPSPWYNKLTNEIIDAQQAHEEYNKLNFTTFGQYHDYYMMKDVLLLTDVFEEFRRSCVEEFNTDPVHFQGAPSLTWYLGVSQNPELFKIILDKNVYMDIQNNIRGGISQAMTRYCNVEDKPNESMFFLDVNSLYSKCMTYKMPGRYLRKEENIESLLKWQELWQEHTRETAILVVDLVYPEHLHDRDWAYPLAPHHYNDRLCTTFKRRENYMVHCELLAFYLRRGLVLEKIHYAYVFEQDYTLREYVQNNIEKRRQTRSEVMKTLYKLLNNSLYGKTCENVNKYRLFKVIEDETLNEEVDDLERVNPELSDAINVIHCGEKMLIEKPVKEVKLNKPIQIGFTILEFAKREIYQFIAAIQNQFGDNVIPLYTDTDSLLFWCNFPRPWERFYNSPLIKFLDFEKVPEHWNVKTSDTDKQSGLWSPEAGGKEIVEYVGLRAKSYCYRFRDNEVVIKNKGIPKAAMISGEDETPREKITIQHYRDALFKGEMYHVSQYAIRSFKHEVLSLKQYKLGLSANDLKRAVTSNRAISLPFGYKGQVFHYLTTDNEDLDLLDT